MLMISGAIAGGTGSAWQAPGPEFNSRYKTKNSKIKHVDELLNLCRPQTAHLWNGAKSNIHITELFGNHPQKWPPQKKMLLHFLDNYILSMQCF